MIGIDDVREARARIGDAVYRSPCARSEHFSRRCGATTYFKLENLQMTGSFKERGALNRLLTLQPEERRRGTITASAGNHAQAVAFHASRLGISSAVVMPKRTPLIKVANTRDMGGEVILHGDDFDAAYARAREIEAERDLTFVHPFDDDLVIAGQGTIGLELLDEVPDLDVVIVAIGGGGMISGIATAVKALRPQVEVIGVQTVAVPSMIRSLECGTPTLVPPATTIADGIAVKRPGGRTLEIVRRLVDDIVTVGEEEIANAILLLLEREKTVAEGAAATTLAALINGHVPRAAGKKVCMVLGGGNVDVNVLARVIERGLMKDQRLVRLDVKLQDRPGALVNLLRLVADAEANVLEVHHERAFEGVSLGEVDVELTLETRGAEHAAEIVAQIEAAGLEIVERPEEHRRR
jgi:threonine dehydratase